ERFVRPLLDRAAMRVIMTGAGTSAFIGECLAPHLSAALPCRVEAIPTTDLVCSPRLYLEAETPTLLVSCARSGNSPESVAALTLADELVGEIHHLAITCNPDGALARRIGTAGNGIAILLPEETNDRSFAMTSSFTCMMYAALVALCGIARMQGRIDRMAQAVETVIATQADAMKSLAERGYERVVYLGSHNLQGACARGRAEAPRAHRRQDDRRPGIAARLPTRAEDDRQQAYARRDIPLQRRLYTLLRRRSAGRDRPRGQGRRPARD